MTAFSRLYCPTCKTECLFGPGRICAHCGQAIENKPEPPYKRYGKAPAKRVFNREAGK